MIKASFRHITLPDGTGEMHLTDVETEEVLIRRTLDKPKVVGPMRTSYGNLYRVRSEMGRIARKKGIKIL